MRHSDSVGSGKGEDSQNYDISRQDSDETKPADSTESTQEDTTEDGNPSTVDVSDDPEQ